MSDLLYDHALQSIAKQRAQDYIREADIDHLLSERHPHGASWWSRQSRRPLQYLGHALTRLGQHLESLDMPNAELRPDQDVIRAATPNR